MLTVTKMVNSAESTATPSLARSHYGSDFAAGCSESDRLTDVLDQLDEQSLDKLARDYEAGKLAQISPN
jgi:hypothetical protein